MLRLTRTAVVRSILNSCRLTAQRFSTQTPGNGSFNFNYISEFDTASIANLLQETQLPMQTAYEKISTPSFWNCYNALDEFSRELLFYLSSDLGLGLATSIVLVSIGIKLAFLKPALRSFMGALKMKELEPQMAAYQEKMKVAQQTRNYPLMNAAKNELVELRRSNNIRTSDIFLNLLQLPILMTWFFSLRYVMSLPEFYPMVKTDGLLWFRDLSTYDSFFILPLLSAFFSYFNLSRSPNLKGGVATVPLIAQLQQYMKYIPFAALTVMIWFPSGLNLYWSCLAFSQSMLTVAINNPKMRQLYGIGKKQRVHEKILKAMIMERPKKLGQTTEQARTSTEQPKASNDYVYAAQDTLNKKHSPPGSQLIGDRVQIVRSKPKKPKN